MTRRPATGSVGWLSTSVEAVPGGDDWLTAEEHEALRRLRVARRRADWRLGRWTAKQAVAAWSAVDGRAVRPAEVGVTARSDDDGRPEVHVLDGPPPSLTLSHRDGVGLAAVGPTGARLGCDLERVEPRSARFPRDWFTATECRRLDATEPAARDALVTLVWSVKESVLKAVGEGLRRDTRSVEVDLGAGVAPEAAWSPWWATDGEDGTVYACWARGLGRHLAVVAVDPTTAGSGAPEAVVGGRRA